MAPPRGVRRQNIAGSDLIPESPARSSYFKSIQPMSHDLVRFDAWFSACYERLRRYLGPDGPDEDTFHDTYLLVREKARSPEVDILDFGAYFCGCYRRISLHKRCTPHCCIHPGEDFFLRLGALRFRKRISEPATVWCRIFWNSYGATSLMENTACSRCAITKPAGNAVIGRWPNMQVRHLPRYPARCGVSYRPYAGTAASHYAVTCLESPYAAYT